MPLEEAKERALELISEARYYLFRCFCFVSLSALEEIIQ